MLACLACGGCRRPENRDVTVWLMPTTNGVRTEVSSVAIPPEFLDSILRQIQARYDDTRLVICLSKGVSASNAMPILTLAEKHGLTNVVVRLNQTRPPDVPDKRDRGIVEPPD
jgi:hypothetical protein